MSLKVSIGGRVRLPWVEGSQGAQFPLIARMGWWWLYVWVLLSKNWALRHNMPLSSAPLTSTEKWTRIGLSISIG